MLGSRSTYGIRQVDVWSCELWRSIQTDDLRVIAPLPTLQLLTANLEFMLRHISSSATILTGSLGLGVIYQIPQCYMINI